MILADLRLDRLLSGASGPVAALRQCLGDPGMGKGMADLVLFEVMRGFREGKVMRSWSFNGGVAAGGD